MSLRLSIGQFCLRRSYRPLAHSTSTRIASFSHVAARQEEKAPDPRLKEEVGDLVIEDQYAILREKYGERQTIF